MCGCCANVDEKQLAGVYVKPKHAAEMTARHMPYVEPPCKQPICLAHIKQKRCTPAFTNIQPPLHIVHNNGIFHIALQRLPKRLIRQARRTRPHMCGRVGKHHARIQIFLRAVHMRAHARVRDARNARDDTCPAACVKLDAHPEIPARADGVSAIAARPVCAELMPDGAGKRPAEAGEEGGERGCRGGGGCVCEGVIGPAGDACDGVAGGGDEVDVCVEKGNEVAGETEIVLEENCVRDGAAVCEGGAVAAEETGEKTVVVVGDFGAGGERGWGGVCPKGVWDGEGVEETGYAVGSGVWVEGDEQREGCVCVELGLDEGVEGFVERGRARMGEDGDYGCLGARARRGEEEEKGEKGEKREMAMVCVHGCADGKYELGKDGETHVTYGKGALL